MEKISGDDAKRWYAENRVTYENLNAMVRGTIESLIKNTKIEVLSVSGRAKTLESFVEKIERKGYDKPAEQMTDLCGIRIITYIEDDVDKVCEIIKKSFHVHKNKSLNKSDELAIDRFGYRSVHFVCDLGKKRTGLPEYDLYEGMLFEVQVRTVLQHAWAEIEHDRSYKFSGALPSPLKRRLHLIAGMLEMADREFNSIAQELETYSKEVSAKTQRGDFNVELNNTSVIQYFRNFMSIDNEATFKIPPISSDRIGLIVNELKRFGINSLDELNKLIDNFWDQAQKMKAESKGSSFNVAGLLRYAMIHKDIDHYFEEAWDGSWRLLSSELEDFIVKTHGKKKLEQIVAQYEIGSVCLPLE